MSSSGESGNPIEPDLANDSGSTSIKGLSEEDLGLSPSPDALNDQDSVQSESHDGAAESPVAEEVAPKEPSIILRQGPWMHPFPLIVGVSIIGLLVALFTANLQINRLTEELGKTDYFHTPPNLSQLITRIQKSTMVVTCGESQGSGWVIALGEVIDSADEETKKIDKLYPGSVITNYHVIEDCVGARKSVTTSNGKEQYEAILFSTDKENDLAIVSTKLVLPSLETSKEPKPGWWSMALGSPFGIEKSISIGNIMNVVDQQIISTAPINPGNSGGPLVNSFGEVIGTNTWKLNGADGINVAKSVQLLCSNLVACTTPFWK
jgi:S1-C subfamily serine protease